MATAGNHDEDARLVRAFCAGNTEAFGTLADRHFGMVYLAGYARLAHREAAEDLAQEVFLRAFLSLRRIDPPRCFSAWLRQIACNLAIDWLRRDQRASRLVRMVPIEEFGEGIVDAQSKGAGEIVETDEKQRALRDAIMELPPEQRELVLLHYVEGLSKREIARRVALHPATVGRRLDRALSAMKKALEPVLREAAGTLGASSASKRRAMAGITALSVMSAAQLSVLAKAAGVAAAPAAQLANSGAGATAIGALLASLKATLAAAAKGATIMSMKAKIGIAAATVSLLLGGAYYYHHQRASVRTAAGETKPARSNIPGALPVKLKVVSPSEKMAKKDVPFHLGGYQNSNIHMGGYGAWLRSPKPPAIENEPETFSELPLYGFLNLTGQRRAAIPEGEGQLAFRLDESSGAGTGYDRLIIDTNNNGDLTDDPVIESSNEFTSRELKRRIRRRDENPFQSENVYFGPIELSTGSVTGVWRPRIEAVALVSNWTFDRDRYGLVRFENLGCLETVVQLDGVEHKIRICDANFDLQIGFRSRVLRLRDEPEAVGPIVLPPRYEVLSPLMYFGADLYSVAPAEDLSTLRFGPYEGPTGELAIPDCIKRVDCEWQSPDGKYVPLDLPDSNRVRLPAGRYSLGGGFQIAVVDHEGGGIRGEAYWREITDLSYFEVEPNKTTALALGPPLAVEIEVRKKAAGEAIGGPEGAPIRLQDPTKWGRPWKGTLPGRAPEVPYVEIEVRITGARGENYRLWFDRFSKYGKAMRIIARFRILDENGSQVLSDSLRSQSGHYEVAWFYVWHIPKHLLGKRVRIVPVLDLSPLEATCKPLDLQL